MTREPDFDQLLGADVDQAERERLRRVHDLLVEAGPPPELSPEIELGPTLGMTLARNRPRRAQRRMLLLAAAVAVLALAFLGGYLAGNSGNGLASAKVLKLAGTSAAPNALASLQIEPKDPAGNWSMKLAATGLPKLPAHGYYTVWLWRDGKAFAPCGTFVVAGPNSGISVWLNAPYKLKPHDSWVVTKQIGGDQVAGPVVLRPTV